MKVLYFMHNDWDWIKQRSHFITEELSKKILVHVIAKRSFIRKNLIENRFAGCCWKLPLIPFGLRQNALLRFVDSVCFKSLIRMLHKKYRYDLVIITHPLLFQYISWHKKIVFDMHDDNTNFFSKDTFLHQYIKEQNTLALAASTHVIFSSDYLSNKFKLFTKSYRIVRNGHNTVYHEKKIDNAPKKTTATICYFGTVSEWFDIDLVLFSVQHMPHIHYEIIGPVDIEKTRHERIKWRHPMDHEAMTKLASKADGYVMPFKLNELVKGVDPVKFYEYISFGKPIISVYYEGLKQFTPFVYFYRNQREYIELLTQLVGNKLSAKATKRDIKSFLDNTTWKIRAAELLDFVSEEIS